MSTQFTDGDQDLKTAVLEAAQKHKALAGICFVILPDGSVRAAPCFSPAIDFATGLRAFKALMPGIGQMAEILSGSSPGKFTVVAE